jgi:ABC-type lipoprotein export system ATPase subunit
MEAAARDIKTAARMQGISFVYGAGAAATHALKGITLEVHRGEVLLLMGPSGSGKSTLLQILGCIRHPVSGAVWIEGQAVSDLSEDALSRFRAQEIGFVFQQYNLLPALRAWENVALALEIRGTAGVDIEDRSRQTLDFLGLGTRANAYPAELSGGEQQRVAIARALAGKPGLILADEPTASLDTASGRQVARLLADIAHEQDCAVVVVTHDSRISGVADRIAVLEDGAIRSIKRVFQ